MPRTNASDLVGGLLVVAIGLAFLIGATDLRFGSSRGIGPGYMPTILSVAVILLGLLLTAFSFRGSAAFPAIGWRPLFLVIAAIGVFGAVVYSFGLIPAVMASILVASFAAGPFRLSTVAMMVGMSVGVWIVFLVGLNLPIPAFRSPF